MSYTTRVNCEVWALGSRQLRFWIYGVDDRVLGARGSMNALPDLRALCLICGPCGPRILYM